MVAAQSLFLFRGPLSASPALPTHGYLDPYPARSTPPTDADRRRISPELPSGNGSRAAFARPAPSNGALAEGASRLMGIHTDTRAARSPGARSRFPQSWPNRTDRRRHRARRCLLPKGATGSKGDDVYVINRASRVDRVDAVFGHEGAVRGAWSSWGRQLGLNLAKISPARRPTCASYLENSRDRAEIVIARARHARRAARERARPSSGGGQRRLARRWLA